MALPDGGALRENLEGEDEQQAGPRGQGPGGLRRGGDAHHPEANSPEPGPSDMVTLELLIKALKSSSPGILILQGAAGEGSSCTLTVDSRLGVGSYGYVEKCRLKLPEDNYEQLVAVKRFYTGHRPSLHQVDHFLREASVLASLNHRSIVRLIGIGSADGSVKNLYTALELLEGPNLMEVVEQQIGNRNRQVYRVEDAVRWCLQVADVLRFLHIEHDLVHRDIKLSNLAATSSDLQAAEVKLLDWGLATKVTPLQAEREDSSSSRRRQSDSLGSLHGQRKRPVPAGKRSKSYSRLQVRASSSASAASSLTRLVGDPRLSSSSSNSSSSLRSVGFARMLPQSSNTGSDVPELNTGSMGTAIYMAPEARLSSSVGTEADIYSFGLMMYELMSGTTVLCEAAKSGHTAGTGAAAMANNLWRPSFSDRCPPEVVELIRQCWNPDPVERPTADTVVTRLEALQERLEADNAKSSFRSDPPAGHPCPSGGSSSSAKASAETGTEEAANKGPYSLIRNISLPGSMRRQRQGRRGSGTGSSSDDGTRDALYGSLARQTVSASSITLAPYLRASASAAEGGTDSKPSSGSPRFSLPMSMRRQRSRRRYSNSGSGSGSGGDTAAAVGGEIASADGVPPEEGERGNPRLSPLGEERDEGRGRAEVPSCAPWGRLLRLRRHSSRPPTSPLQGSDR